MTRSSFVAVAILMVAVLLVPASASNVPSNQVNIANLWTNLGSNPLGGYTLLNVSSSAFTLPSLHPVTGVYGTAVFSYDAAGHLVFAYQVHLDNSPPNPPTADVQKISSGDWDPSITVDAKQFALNPGDVASGGINRLNGVITIYWQTPLVKAGQTSYIELLYTNATQYTTDTFGIQDGAGTTVSGFIPLAPTTTPEPATLSLLGIGLAGLAALRKRSQN